MARRRLKRYAGAGLGEELFGAMPNVELAARAALAFVLALGTLVLQLDAEPFALLYSLDVGFRMVLTGTVSYVRFNRSRGEVHRLDPFWGALFLTLIWLGLVFVPVVGIWASVSARTLGGKLSTVLGSFDLGVAGLALLLLGLAVRQARAEAREPEREGPTLYKPVLARALCIAAFVFFGPPVFGLLRESGVSEPTALAVTYALSESYPFVATLIDRALHRPARSADEAVG